MEGAKNYNGEFENLKATELRLGLPGADDEPKKPVVGNKRTIEESPEANFAPVAKAQIVGWPPVRSFRKNNVQARKAEAEVGGMFVKVSMDGAPYLRKVDLKMYKGYKELREALENLFKGFSLGEMEGSSDYAITYEDKDGDWMLVGDVPWGMFISSCKRLRVMRGAEARGLDSNP
ncbi:uncharacterized protein A4U43_C03F5820 [Asparagus officinalis]|uniref:Auxin-responsive protein n=1 Tax=Asparagus officinalis TaxID=4686 RepID=A0A5P1FC29_ASPOF|nr:auxin-induced protein 22D-like [Asparagus officinalis]ONK74399.1 uncharacterized protein A4U43_C03F5820 [Asparagus officinalis]